MTGLLDRRTAIVTGASRGIGRAIAELFAAEGARVVLTARTAADLDAVASAIESAGGSAVAVPADITAEDTAGALVDAAIGAYSGLDIIVNNAGGNSFMAAVADLRPSAWSKAMLFNLESGMRLIQAGLPSLVAGGHGSIINVSSVTALRAAPLLGAYGAAKAALVSATQTLAVELGTQPVRANALVPGWIATDLTEFARGDEGLQDALIGRVPMARWGRPEEIAQAALFLASDMSSFMTGQTLVVDGGLAANP
jgi:NAD(P)-dependent dehydrogenase (short-subunit alcohol dehydrogenase family)